MKTYLFNTLISLLLAIILSACSGQTAKKPSLTKEKPAAFTGISLDTILVQKTANYQLKFKCSPLNQASAYHFRYLLGKDTLYEATRPNATSTMTLTKAHIGKMLTVEVDITADKAKTVRLVQQFIFLDSFSIITPAPDYSSSDSIAVSDIVFSADSVAVSDIVFRADSVAVSDIVFRSGEIRGEETDNTKTAICGLDREEKANLFVRNSGSSTGKSVALMNPAYKWYYYCPRNPLWECACSSESAIGVEDCLERVCIKVVALN